jgi:hypothetical protein
MGKIATPTSNLSRGEQRALSSFLAGRLPAGQLHGELRRAREEAIAKAVAQAPPSGASLAPALHAA